MSRWARLFSRRKRMMEDLDQDIRDYIERETQDNIERGMSPEEAHYAALRKFGNVTRVKEDTWEVWSFVWLEQLWQDVVRPAPTSAQSRLHGRGRHHAGAGHRREHGDFQSRQRRVLPWLSLSPRGPARVPVAG